MFVGLFHATRIVIDFSIRPPLAAVGRPPLMVRKASSKLQTENRPEFSNSVVKEREIPPKINQL